MIEEGPAIFAVSPGRINTPEPRTELAYSATACFNRIAFRRAGLRPTSSPFPVIIRLLQLLHSNGL